MESVLEILRRWRTRRDHKIRSLPVVVLFPHSACNCRCIMCDIWKSNKNLKQILPEHLDPLLEDLASLRIRQIVLSGGEPLLHQNLFEMVTQIRTRLPKTRITLLSTGLLLEKHAERITELTDEVIVSLDGPRAVHDDIRQIPGAYEKLKTGLEAVRNIDPDFPLTARCVIQQRNYAHWIELIDVARKELALDSISFLAGDTDTTAFNRETTWDANRKYEVLVPKEEIPRLRNVLRDLIDTHQDLIGNYIQESRPRLEKIVEHYAAYHNLGTHQSPVCNAPWTSTVIEADGTVLPCFFHPEIGNIHETPLQQILDNGRTFRKQLDIAEDPICKKCVCHLNVPTARSFI